MRRLVGQIHLWTGLLFCAPFVLIGLTGSILVFEDELRTAFAPAVPGQSGVTHPAGEIVAVARVAAPKAMFRPPTARRRRTAAPAVSLLDRVYPSRSARE